MPKAKRPFLVVRRSDSKTFQITLNVTCGLPRRICREWTRQSFQKYPEALAPYRNPKTKAAAEAGAYALIQFLKNEMETGTVNLTKTDSITVGNWLKKFTAIETSPRTARNAARNRPYSIDTLDTYKTYYNAHIKDDALSQSLMSEVEEQDALEFINRMSIAKLETGELMGGTRTFAGVIGFVRMAFKEYGRNHNRWFNPFLNIDPPKLPKVSRDALPEKEMVKLFVPGVLNGTMELAVCAAMFLAGLRRSEIFALKPECLDWKTPKITVKNAWQNYDKKTKVLGPTKGKKERDAPFDPVLQNAIKKLWEENGRHEFVFCFKDGSLPGPTWIYTRFDKWLAKAGIETEGRKIVPHSARHSLASLLEQRGIPLRYIQDLLGHSDLETTINYLHTTEATIRNIGKKITKAMEADEKIIEFKVS